MLLVLYIEYFFLQSKKMNFVYSSFKAAGELEKTYFTFVNDIQVYVIKINLILKMNNPKTPCRHRSTFGSEKFQPLVFSVSLNKVFNLWDGLIPKLNSSSSCPRK